jgi:hypothetical protein
MQSGKWAMSTSQAAFIARNCFFFGAFGQDQFVAQIYIGVVNWDLPEFEIGYFVGETEDRDMSPIGQALSLTFEHAKPSRCLRYGTAKVR